MTMSYGDLGSIDNGLSRVASLIDSDGTHLVDYMRIGVATFVQAASPEAQLAWSLINGTGTDPYSGIDQFNRVVDNRWYNTTTGADLDRIQHGYDRASNRLWRKNTVADATGVHLDELYGHDGLYRLARLDRGELNSTNTAITSGTEDFTQAWGLDATGNWSSFDQADVGGAWTLQQTRTSNKANEIIGIAAGGWIVPSYDASGNTTQFPQSNAPSTGNQAVYDAWNRLISISSSGSHVEQSVYDGVNRRVVTQISGTTRHSYYSYGWRDVEERVGAGVSADRQFVWGVRYIDDLVLRDRDSERFYTMHDPNWNVTGIVSAAGTVSERYAYAPYGQPLFMSDAFGVRTSSMFAWETLFASYRYDAPTGLFHVRSRVYHPGLGTWLQRDPLGLIAGLNLYEYLRSAPLSATDPWGLLPWWASYLLGLIPFVNILTSLFQSIPGSSVSDYASCAPSAADCTCDPLSAIVTCQRCVSFKNAVFNVQAVGLLTASGASQAIVSLLIGLIPGIGPVLSLVYFFSAVIADLITAARLLANNAAAQAQQTLCVCP